MVRAFVLAALLSVLPHPAAVQTLSVLHIKVVLVDADRKATPVARHALLISDNPATEAPRRVVTTLNGTADVRLRPGNYTVESDRPVAFQGKAYQWNQTLNIVAGAEAVLELTIDNAEVEAIGAPGTAAALETDPSLRLTKWRESVVPLWTPTTHASGFLIDANGLIATNQRVVGTATSIEVQLTSSLKVAASVLAADPVRNVAVLRIDPKVAPSKDPVTLECARADKPTVARGQHVFALGASLGQEKHLTSATVTRVGARAIESDLTLAIASSGGPLFTAEGDVLGLTTFDEREDARRGDARIVLVDDVCATVAAAQKKVAAAPPSSDTPLPLEPSRPFPEAALRDAAEHRAGSISPYRMSSSDFDIAFITPVQIYGAKYQSEQAARRGSPNRPSIDGPFTRPLMDFSNWSDYVADLPSVLLIRVTPRLSEGLLAKLARGAAYTQGVALPAFKHLSSGFLRMRALCGAADVTPIHPFKLEQQISDKEAIYEGLYVFDPGAFPPTCAGVKLVLYSEKEPDKADTRVVDPKIVQQIWDDFAPYRAQ